MQSRVVVLNSGDENKTFSILLRTPPENDKGIAHCLERITLCGS